MRRCLIIFAKEPKKGLVKTRLQGHLKGKCCVNLYKAFLHDTVELAKKISCEIKILAYTSHDKNPRYLKKIAPSFTLYKQEGKDLGERMYNAFRFALKKNASKTVIIGSDSPTLPIAYIEQAFDRLDGNDVVLGPSRDGGYYLIGLKRPTRALFEGVNWGAPSVLRETMANSRRIKKSFATLHRWYDVDDYKALIHLVRDLERNKKRKDARWTRAILSQFS